MKKDNPSIEIRDMRNGDWYWISRLVYEEYAPEIKPIGLALYNAYASYARDKGKAFPSQNRIAKILGISQPTIRKYDKILEKNGLIKVDSGKNRGTSNIVYLLKVKKGNKQFTTPSKNTFHPGGKQITTKEKQLERDTTKEKFPSKKRFFFRGNPMVESPKDSGRWFVIQQNGEWLEFAGGNYWEEVE